MTPEDYWSSPLKPKKGTKTYLRGETFYYDFEWSDVFKSSKDSWSRFPGIKIVSEVVATHVPGRDWSNVVIILTLNATEPVKHEERGGKHFFVFDADQLQKRRHAATTSFLGEAAKNTPEMLDAYQLYKQSPEALRQAMLAADAQGILSGLEPEQARELLPIALGILTHALAGDQNQVDTDADLLDQVEMDALVRALQVLLAKARDRGDVSAVLSVLDSLPNEQRAYFAKNPSIVKAVAEEDIDTMQVTSWAYRKSQLQIYEEMLESEQNVKEYKDKNGIMKPGEEPAWQHFFEQNRWIFGLALDYYFNQALSEERLEIFSKGTSFLEEGKRPDAVMATVALIRSMCFVEIKTPRKPLLGGKYRDDAWGPSHSLTGAVAQSHKAVYRSVRSLGERFRLMDEDGAEHGNPIYTVHPHSFVIIGKTTEFITTAGEDKTKRVASFELYRRELVRPDVITFDELLERARRLVDLLPETNSSMDDAYKKPMSEIPQAKHLKTSSPLKAHLIGKDI